MNDTASLYDALGRRLYLTPGERDAFLRTAMGHDRPVRTFCSALYYTGCRISEGLHLTPRRVDFAHSTQFSGRAFEDHTDSLPR
jgi:integrase/recombinase XerD